MFAARWVKEFGGLALSLLGGLIGWLLIAPVAAITPRRRDWIAVIGRQHGKFLDNAKYFFLDASSHAADLHLVFITERSDVLALFEGSSRKVLRYPGIRASWYLLRCGSVVADSTDWGRHLRRFILIRARVLQLWHGVGFKRIELDKWRNETGRYRVFSQPWVFALRVLFYRVTGRVVRYDAVNTTSRFYCDKVFAPAFLSNRFLITGYPRNAFTRVIGSGRKLAWSNVDAAVACRLDEWARLGRRLVVVAPTMRDSGTVPMKLNAHAVGLIDAFAESRGIEFLFKFHPSESCANQVAGRHIHLCSADSDLYPLFPYTHGLITDYSSIYMDYLLLDKPVLFLIPDGDSYTHEDRQVQFDLVDMMPGPIVTSWPELLGALESQWQHDTCADARARLCRKAFDGLSQEKSVPKLIDFMRAEGWVRGRQTMETAAQPSSKDLT
jgi:CDP-glycerol glycerophosphotransferase (TagB/SpsB family)